MARKSSPPPASAVEMQDNKCLACEKWWKRPMQKGRRPKYCPSCREDPGTLKQAAQEAEEESRRRASEVAESLTNRVNALKLKHNRNYSLSDMLDRIEALEARLEKLEINE